MPEVFRALGFKFFFYSNEGTPREPIHVHVEKGNDEAKIWVVPVVAVAYNDGYTARAVREIVELVEANEELIERIWNDHFR